VRVLVVDDEPEFRALLCTFLAAEGMEVTEAGNGLDALLAIRRARPDGVVLDLRMPRLGGIAALERIQAGDPTIVVVVVTADSDPIVHEQARRFGARAVLMKPVELDAVARALTGAAAPLTVGAASVPVSAPAPLVEELVPPVDPAAGRLLIVDDEDAVREMLMEFFVTAGYQVDGAGDALSATKALKETPADVVLLDIQMPGLSGAELLPGIRALAPRAAVIMVSGNADEILARRTLAQGAFDYVTKPIDFAYLVQSVEAALTMRALAD
jgi:CheY-like chemotaxis protein